MRDVGKAPAELSQSQKDATIMFAIITKNVVYAWNFIFDHEVSPVRHISDIAMRHYILQALGLIWAVCFSIALGSYTFLAMSVLGHTLLIGAAAITVATLSTAAAKPQLFVRGSGRRIDGEHE
jgi:hypothetical protein